MSVTRPIPTVFFLAVFLVIVVASVIMLASVIGRHNDLTEESREQVEKVLATQLDLLARGKVEDLRATFTEPTRAVITREYVESRKATYAGLSPQQLLGKIEVWQRKGEVHATVHTPDGHLLGHFVRRKGIWLAEDPWFR